jgi:hypothetical protein
MHGRTTEGEILDLGGCVTWIRVRMCQQLCLLNQKVYYCISFSMEDDAYMHGS